MCNRKIKENAFYIFSTRCGFHNGEVVVCFHRVFTGIDRFSNTRRCTHTCYTQHTFTTSVTNRSAENKNKYRKARNETKKVIAKAMRQEAEEEMNVLCTKPNDVFKFVKFMRKEGRDIDGGGCTKDKDGRLVVSEKDRGKLWKEHNEKIMNVENEWDQMVEIDMVEGPVERVTDEELMEAMNNMKLGKAAGAPEVNMDMIIASGTFGVGVMKKLCQSA